MRGAKVDQGGDDEEEEVRLGKVLDFMRLLWSVDHGLQSLSKRMDARLGVTGPQRLVIRIVGRFPGISPGEIADILKVHKSTLTGVLQRLEERGLIERKASPEDRRRALVRLTAAGQKVNAVRSGTVEAALRRTINKLPVDKLAAAEAVLASIASELQRES
ncbi:MAG TPA: MarR family transcriptional regulator [Polyangiaceae bacterium]|jgi:DNA-binding MarR family transcriptional regulator|nr:MarR family transcriptional regulator [Polyangiaceae bacterium]